MDPEADSQLPQRGCVLLDAIDACMMVNMHVAKHIPNWPIVLCSRQMIRAPTIASSEISCWAFRQLEAASCGKLFFTGRLTYWADANS